MRTLGLSLSALLAFGSCAGHSPAKAPSDLELTPGDYELVLQTTSGPGAGRTAIGRVHLEPSISGQREDLMLWGWADVEFGAVGAPLMLTEDSPSPLSRDPQSPGVVVTGSGARSSLWIGSFMNMAGVVEDGEGIVLEGDRIGARTLRGRWKEAGIVHAGRGTFALTRLRNQKPPAEMRVTPIAEAQFLPLDPSRPGLASMAVLSGDPKTGPSTMLLRMGRGSGRLHVHTADYQLVVIRGTMKHWSKDMPEEKAPLLEPGSTWFQPGNVAHGDSCLADECEMYIVWSGARDARLAE
jgi:hypothetical protein